MSRLQPPFVLSSRLAQAALSFAIAIPMACEVRVETPPEIEDPYDPLNDSPLGHYEDTDAPPAPYVPRNSEPEPPPLQPAEPPYTGLTPELYPTLIVIDADVIQGPLASNARAGAPFSFRAQMEWLAGEREPIGFTRAWIEQWETVTAVGPAEAPVVPRPAARHLLLDPWWAASGSAIDEPSSTDPPDAAYGGAGGANNAGGSGAAGSTLPTWSDAPFRLIAIVNRVDLASDPCAAGGEIRYVYTAIDPATGYPLDMTAILEVPYPSTRRASEWARAWQDLGALAPNGDAYAAALERIAREVHAEADPLRARLLTSEIELESDTSPGWEMREFHLQIEADQLALVQAPLERTPRSDVDAARLSEHVLTHVDAIRGPGVALPEDMQAGAAPLTAPDFRWRVLGVSESLRHAFSVQTCNGCHGGEAETLPFQHITPTDIPGISARVSRTLYDPDADSDVLRRRLARLDELAQSVCELEPGGGGYP